MNFIKNLSPILKNFSTSQLFNWRRPTFQLFNLSTLLAAALCAATGSADVPQVLTYRGVL